MQFSPLTLRRLKNFKSNRRGYYSTLVFMFLFSKNIISKVVIKSMSLEKIFSVSLTINPDISLAFDINFAEGVFKVSSSL